MLVDRIKQALEQAYWAGVDLCPTGTSLDYKSMEIKIDSILFEFEKEVYNLEALAALVTEELAKLLEKLADQVSLDYSPGYAPQSCLRARALAARIGKALNG